jgi:hypothetical protein
LSLKFSLENGMGADFANRPVSTRLVLARGYSGDH